MGPVNLPSAWGRLGEIPWAALNPALRGELAPVLASVLSGTPAERALDRFLRRHRDLDSPSRRAVAEAIFGVSLWRRRLAALLAFPRWEDAPPSALLDALVQRPDLPLPDRLAARASLPDWLERLLLDESADLGDPAAFAEAVNLPGPVCLRVQRATRAELLPTLPEARACALSPLGVILDGRPNVLGLPAYQRGLLEPQDEGSQLLGLLLDARPGETLLDFCAGAGGKTLLLAGVTSDRATIHAHDPDPERLARLRQRAARAGFTSIRAGSLPASPCDRVLVDAPCSELGALRRGPDLRWRIDPASFARLPALQAEILAAAARHVRPGGRLVYATCTIRRAENESVCFGFERAHPGFRREAPLFPSLSTPDGFFRILPHLHGTDGFFAATWTRRAVTLT